MIEIKTIQKTKTQPIKADRLFPLLFFVIKKLYHGKIEIWQN